MLGLTGDRVWPGQARLRVPFGDAFRDVPTGPARIAIRAGAAVFTSPAVRPPAGPRPYRLTIEPEVPQRDLGGEPADELTRRIAARLSVTAERYPDQWFVFTPQWIGASSRP